MSESMGWAIAALLYAMGAGPWAVMAQERNMLWTRRGAVIVLLWPLAAFLAACAAIHDMLSSPTNTD